MFSSGCSTLCWSLCWIWWQLHHWWDGNRFCVLINTQTKVVLQETVLQNLLWKDLYTTWSTEGNMTRLYRFWEKQPVSLSRQSFLWGSLCSCSLKTDLSEGSAQCKLQKEFFSALYRRRVVKGFGSDYLTKVGAVCVKASFMAVEIWCGE